MFYTLLESSFLELLEIGLSTCLGSHIIWLFLVLFAYLPSEQILILKVRQQAESCSVQVLCPVKCNGMWMVLSVKKQRCLFNSVQELAAQLCKSNLLIYTTGKCFLLS